MFFIFNFFFLLNVEKGESYDNSINRISQVNDGSNFLRFTINATVLDALFVDPNFKFGYGNITGGHSSEYESNYMLMPHNELLDSVAEFGYLFTLYAFFFSGLFYRKCFVRCNYEYVIPIIIYTLILWERFLIVPSLEMFFILIMLNNRIRSDEKFINIGK